MKFIVTKLATYGLTSLDFSLLIYKTGTINCPAFFRVVRRIR